MASTHPSWERVSDLFHQALEREPGAREAFLEGAAAGDGELLRRVRSLLQAHLAVESGGDPLASLASGPGGRRASALLDWAGEAAPADLGPVPGESVGRYRILKRLGHGGAGAVFQAHDPVLDRTVALKLLPPGIDGARVLEEARAASALDHPGIGTIHEVGETPGGGAYIAMASYDGGTLRQRLRDGPLPVEEAVSIALQVAEALDAAHARGILHRDVKPENLVFDDARRVRLVDFGIARTGGTEPSPGPAPGTAAYMSPERLAGEPAGPESDVWSLGAVLFEMLTGERPFPGRDRSELLREITSSTPPPVTSLRPEIDDALAAVVDRALSADPGARYASGAEFAADLRRVSPGHRVSHSRPSPARHRRMAVAAGGAGVVLFLAGAAVAVQAPRLVDARGTAAGTFTPRGAVLVADFETAPALAELALATREALLVDLQQSGFVQAVPRSRVQDALRRMGREPDEPVQGEVALEVAERTGAGVVLTTTVARAGTRYVLSGRGLVPGSGEELFAVRTSAGERNVLRALERLSREIRGRLGEAAESLRESRPLPEVTTASLEALRFYAVAERVFTSDLSRSLDLLRAALEIDPEFAMAHRLAAAASVNQLQFSEAERHIGLAWEHRDRLNDKERWHLEAVRASEVDFEPRRAEELYQRLLSRFPDDSRAAFNLGTTRLSWLGDPQGALAALRRGLRGDPTNLTARAIAAQAALILDRPEVADTIAAAVQGPGSELFGARWRVARAFWADDLVGVRSACAALLARGETGHPSADDREVCGSMDVSYYDPAAGIPRLEAVLEDYLREARHRNAAHTLHALTVAHLLAGDTVRARDRLLSALEILPAATLREPDRFITRTNLRVHATLFGWADAAARTESAYPPLGDSASLLGRGGEALVRAAEAIRRQDGAAALAELEGAFPPGVMPIGWRTFDELLRGYAFQLLGEVDLARIHFDHAANRGWAGIPALTKDRIHLPLIRGALARMGTEDERP